MKLLIFTQIVDIHDTGLGFFHRWIELLAKRSEQVTVVCLKKGQFNFPSNVTVISLGKEEGASRVTYIRRFYSIIFKKRNEYDSVFIHMNQEYMLLGGVFWKLWGKRTVLWYNHTIGSLLTRIAYLFAHAVLYTSAFSYSAKYASKKGKQMGAGIDTDYFDGNQLPNSPVSVLFLGRISPVKKVLEFADALHTLHEKGVTFTATLCGDLGSPADASYFDHVKKVLKPLVANGSVSIQSGVPHEKTKDLYMSHQFYINLTQTGSFDKTVLEAMSLRRFVIVLNKSFERILPETALIPEPLQSSHVADVLQNCLSLSQNDMAKQGERNREYVIKNHSLSVLIESLYITLSSSTR